LQGGGKAGRGRAAAPAIEFPAGAKEFYFGPKGDIENHFGGAAIKLLRDFEQGTLAEILAVGGAPDGNVEGFLFDLFGDGEDTKEGAGSGFGNFNGRAVTVGFENGVFGDEDEFEGHGSSLLKEGV